MNNEQILKKAIEKAVKNGYGEKALKFEYPSFYNDNLYQTIIFSHEFAKSFWGEEEVYNGRYGINDSFIPAWKFYLKQMVLEENPIKYLKSFLCNSEQNQPKLKP